MKKKKKARKQESKQASKQGGSLRRIRTKPRTIPGFSSDAAQASKEEEEEKNRSVKVES